MAICTSEQHIIESCTYSRCVQLSCRCFESPKDQSNRMNTKPFCSSNDFSKMGQTNDGFVCVTNELSDPSLLLMVSMQSSFCNRCSQYLLGEHVCLCLPSNMLNSKSPETYTAVPLSDYSYNPSLAEETLVYRSSGTSNSNSFEITNSSKSSDTIKGSRLASESGVVQSNSLAVIKRRFQTIGFSKKISKIAHGCLASRNPKGLYQ